MGGRRNSFFLKNDSYGPPTVKRGPREKHGESEGRFAQSIEERGIGYRKGCRKPSLKRRKVAKQRPKSDHTFFGEP